MRKPSKLTDMLVVAIFFLLLCSVLVGAFLYTTLMIHGSGSIAVLSAYADSALTARTSTILWGTLSPEATSTQTLWVKNLCPNNVTLAVLFWNWQPSNALDYMNISCDSQGLFILTGQAIPVNFTLTIYASITAANPPITSFSQDINVTGTW